MHTLHRHKSRTGGFITQTIIVVDEPHTGSLASLLLLNDYYQSIDEDFLSATNEIQIYLDKRHIFLTNLLEQEGVLQCHYCTHSNMEIGERLLADAKKNNANPKLATIDHVKPVSSGIDKLDESNWVVSCRRCNKWKGSMSYEDFMIKLPEMLEQCKQSGNSNLLKKRKRKRHKHTSKQAKMNRKIKRSFQAAAS